MAETILQHDPAEHPGDLTPEAHRLQGVDDTRECSICYGEFEPEEPGQTECDPTGCPGRGDGEPVQEVDRG